MKETQPRTLEELVGAFVAAVERERDDWWGIGEAGARVLRVNAEQAPSPEAAKARRDTIYRALGTAAGITAASVKQHVEVWASFRTLEGVRKDDPTRSPSWHRAVHHAALRTGRRPVDLLDEAQAQGWGQRELHALARKRERVAWGGDCGKCGCHVTVSRDGAGAREMAGKPISCPYCGTVLGRLA